MKKWDPNIIDDRSHLYNLMDEQCMNKFLILYSSILFVLHIIF